MATWTITMLDTGTQTQDKGAMTYLTDMGQAIQIPVTVALIEGPTKILVDTSFLSVERTWEIRRRKIVRAPRQELIPALAAAGVPGWVWIASTAAAGCFPATDPFGAASWSAMTCAPAKKTKHSAAAKKSFIFISSPFKPI